MTWEYVCDSVGLCRPPGQGKGKARRRARLGRTVDAVIALLKAQRPEWFYRGGTLLASVGFPEDGDKVRHTLSVLFRRPRES